jgi:phospholipid transport system substrate-binding protein
MTMFMRAHMHLIKKLCLVSCILFSLLSTGAVNALNTAQADKLISSLVKDINTIINSQKPPTFMYLDFKSVLTKYADTKIMSQKVLGIDWRRATIRQRQDFQKAFEHYLSRKYGKRFREFLGGEIIVTKSRKVNSVFEVVSIVKLEGQVPFEVRWLVANKDGNPKMFNLFIEGINVSSAEKTEIGAMLDKRSGSIDKLITHLWKID